MFFFNLVSILNEVWFMLGLHDIQYFYEFLFWVVIYFSLRLVWHRPKVRLVYGISVAVFNFLAIVMYTISSLYGKMGALDAFAFCFAQE